MELIHFIADNSDTNYNCIMSTMENRVKLNLGDNKINEVLVSQGFNILNENNLFVQGDYSAYKYVYYRDGSKFILTKDENDKYVEPVIPTPDPIPELTEEEKEAQKKAELESVKESKIAELNVVCAKKIEEGIEYNGKKYSYTIQDQSNMSSAVNTAKTSGLDVPYHANDNLCELYTCEEISTIHNQEQMNLTMCNTYFNQMKMYIKSIDDVDKIDEINAITWGTELSGKYLDRYNQILAQGQKIVEIEQAKMTNIGA